METNSVRDLDKSWDGLNLEELSWSCGCGTPMALDAPGDGQEAILKCRICGPVAKVRIILDPVQS